MIPPAIRWLLWAIFFLWLLFTPVGNFLVDWQWFSELGYRELLTTKLTMQISLWALVFCVSSIYIYQNIRIASKTDRFKLLYIEEQFAEVKYRKT